MTDYQLIRVCTRDQLKRAIDALLTEEPFKGWRCTRSGTRHVVLAPSNGEIRREHMEVLERVGARGVRAIFFESPEPGIYLFGVFDERDAEVSWLWDREYSRWEAQTSDGRDLRAMYHKTGGRGSKRADGTKNGYWTVHVLSGPPWLWWDDVHTHHDTPGEAQAAALAYYREHAA